ncbi:MAG: ABC transporter ATP-binding protein [Acidimicrobiales bacterium]
MVERDRITHFSQQLATLRVSLPSGRPGLVPERRGVVKLAGVSKSYPGPPPVDVLSGLALTIEAGEYLALMGPSGSGKSTLLNLIGLLDRPSAGQVLLEGVDTSGLSDRRRTALRGSRVGFVFQVPHLVAWRTVHENVVLGLGYAGRGRDEAKAMAAEALAMVGLAERAAAWPSQLSGGQAQRAALARAISIRPALLLCDEPTGNLDSASSDRVLDLLAELHHQGNTIVVVTHDHEVAARADRTVTVRDGRLCEDPVGRTVERGSGEAP